MDIEIIGFAFDGSCHICKKTLEALRDRPDKVAKLVVRRDGDRLHSNQAHIEALDKNGNDV